MKRDGFPARVATFSDAPFSDASTGTRSSVRSRRRSRVFKKQDCDFPTLIAINISTCSRLSSKSSGGLHVGWIISGFAILLAPGKNCRVFGWDDGDSSLL